MRAKEFLNESTQLYLNSGDSVAVRSSLGLGKGTRVTMLITKDQWDAVKNQHANTETMDYDIATAEMIVKDWVNKGSKVYWKTAADWNREARELQNHRFRDDPEVSDKFDTMINKAKVDARSTTKNTLKTV